MTNSKNFNLPAYINIPFFLYQDDRLEKSAMLIAAFFYSLHTAGQSIKASKDYLCQLAGIGKTQYFYTLNQLESFGYIQRTGFTNRKKIKWVYSIISEIIVDETDTSPEPRTSDQQLNTSPDNRTKLVRDPELNLSGIPDTDIKEDTKDYKKLTTVDPNPSSSSFFSEKQKQDLLTYKTKRDERIDEEFLLNCQHHIETQKNEFSKFQRIAGLKHILVKHYETQDIFKANGYEKLNSKPKKSDRPSIEDFQEYNAKVKGYEWVGEWIKKQTAK